MFQQDNSLCHTSRAGRTWLQELSIQVLEWPAQSLDMSPIENLWWSVSKHKKKNLEELKSVIQEEWDKITPQQWYPKTSSHHCIYLKYAVICHYKLE
uniref:Tc1-like transposase DDE domain-containing protein n=1 Tax=Amphiprion ocellaris TaxID=80972 RepID=A0AAQ6AHM7_AMPOC